MHNLENKIKKLAPQDGDVIVIKVPKLSKNETIKGVENLINELSDNFNNLQVICKSFVLKKIWI